jgi:hypothetical protein
MPRRAGIPLVLLVVTVLHGLAPSVCAAGDPAVVSVVPASGTRGTEVTITGSGFGGKKPRVLLEPEAGGKSRRLKVLEWSDGEITARIRKASAGVHGLVVRPKGKGVPEATLPAAFQVVPPSDLVVDLTCVRASDEVAITGTAFGPKKKGRVFVDGRKAKVLSWTADPTGAGLDQAVFRVPAKKVSGVVNVEVRTPVGGTTLQDALLVLDSTDQRFTGTFDDVSFEADVALPATTVDVSGGQTYVRVADALGDSVEFRVLWDPAVDGAATLGGLDILQFTWQHEGKLWVLDVDAELQSSVTLALDPHCEGALLGSYSGFLVERFGTGTVVVSDGDFQVPLDPSR